MYIRLSTPRILQVELQRSLWYQSESDGERIDRALAGLLEKTKGSFSFSLVSCLCLCLCLCLCFFFFFLCSWWWWWWWSLCFEEFDSLLNTERGAAETGCMFISPEDCSLPKRMDTMGLANVGLALFPNIRNSQVLDKTYINPRHQFKHKTMESVMKLVPCSFREGSEHAIEVLTLLTIFRDGPSFPNSIKVSQTIRNCKEP